MNQEVANFVVEFTSKGLAELKEGLGDIQTAVQDLHDDMKKADDGGKGFFDNIGGWIKSIGALTASFIGLRAIIRSIFDVKGEIIDVYNMADIAGVDPKWLEGLGIATEQFRGGGVNSAFDFTVGMNEALGKMKWAEYNEDWVKQMAKFGFTTEYDYNKTEQQNRMAFMEALHRGFANASFLDEQAIKNAFGINDAMYQLLRSDRWQELINAGMDKIVLTDDEKNLQNAVELDIAQKDLKRAWDDLMTELMSVTTQLINDFATPLVQNFSEFAKKHDLGEVLRKWVEQLREWVDNVWPEIRDGFSKLIFILKGLFDVFFGDEGTVWSRWGDFKNSLKDWGNQQKPIRVGDWEIITPTKDNPWYLSDINYADPMMKAMADYLGYELDNIVDTWIKSGAVIDDITKPYPFVKPSGSSITANLVVDPTKNGSASITGDGDVSVVGGIRPAIGGVR